MDTAPGRLVQAPESFWTYVPNPLPPPLEPSWEIMRRLSEADRALAQLAGTGAMLPNPHLLIDPFLRREAALSSRIEGTTATVRQLVLFEATDVQQTNDEPEVHNYVLAMELGLDLLKRLPVSLRLIREVHAQLLQDTRGAEMQPGQFRQQQNMIADSRNQSVVDARFVPPSVPEMPHALHELEQYIHASCDLPPLIRLALIHYQFEAIHPFMDGNGR
ncbi:MAG: Fic family protein, partial [Chloroflexota bacterium]